MAAGAAIDLFRAPVPSLFWLVLAPILSQQSYGHAGDWVGPVVPRFFGSLLVAGPAGLFGVLTMWYAALPIGVITGLLVRFCRKSLGSRPGACAEDLSRVALIVWRTRFVEFPVGGRPVRMVTANESPRHSWHGDESRRATFGCFGMPVARFLICWLR